MSQTITLELPDKMFQPLQRTAQATKQPIENLLLNVLQTSLPPLDELPDEIVENLTSLETLGDAKLRQVLKETVPIKIREKNLGFVGKKERENSD